MNGIRIFTTVLVCALLTSFALAADTIHFREGGGTGYTDVTLRFWRARQTDPAMATTAPSKPPMAAKAPALLNTPGA